jgi:hypothetical protein
MLLGGDDDDGGGLIADSPSPTPTPSPTESSPATDPPPDDPRGGVIHQPDPVVAADWQVAANDRRGIAYDIPPEWTLQAADFVYYVEREETDETNEDENPYLVAMTSVGAYDENWCGADGNPRSATGVRTRQGAANTADMAELEARDWALASYDQNEEGTLEVGESEPFTSEHGMTGHLATATISGFPQDPECPVAGAKVTVFSYLSEAGDLTTWTLVTDTGFEEEPDQDTIDNILNSLRPYQAQE